MAEAAAPPPVPVVAAPSAVPERNSTVEAARRRVRGPTLTEKRLREAADAEKAEEKRLEQRKALKRKKADASRVEGGGAQCGANAVTAAPLSCATATPAAEWDPTKPLAWASPMPVQTQVRSKQQRRGRARMHDLATKAAADEQSENRRRVAWHACKTCTSLRSAVVNLTGRIFPPKAKIGRERVKSAWSDARGSDPW